MENLLWVISGVLLLMSLTALKAVWKLQAQVKDLEEQVQKWKNGVEQGRPV